MKGAGATGAEALPAAVVGETLLSGQEPARLLNRDFVLIWAAGLAFFTSFQLLLTALPIYALRLGARQAEIGLLMGLFSTSAMIMRPGIGWQLDRGRRIPILVLGATIFALSAVGYALVEPVARVLLISPVVVLLAIRLFHGTGMAAFSTTAQTVVVSVAPPRRRGEALGIFGTVRSLAPGLGPATGMAIALALGPLALFATVLAVALLAVAFSALVREPRAATAVRRRARLFNTTVLLPGAAMFALMFTYGVVLSFVPIYALQRGMENPGFFFVVYAGAMLAGQVLAGRASDRYGRPVAARSGLVFASAGLLLTAWAAGPGFLAAAAVYGLGVGACQPTLFAWADDLVPLEGRGSAQAMMGLFLEMGIAVGSIGAGLLAELLGLRATFVACAVVPLVFVLASALRKQTAGRASIKVA